MIGAAMLRAMLRPALLVSGCTLITLAPPASAQVSAYPALANVRRPAAQRRALAIDPVVTIQPPEQQRLESGTQHSAHGGRAATVNSGGGSLRISPSIPAADLSDDTVGTVHHAPAPSIRPGLLGVLRIDGKGRGAAVGLGLAVSRGRIEVDVMMLLATRIGGYLGIRYRLGTGSLRPYVAGGLPGFLYDGTADGMSPAGDPSTKLALGARGAAGVELEINGHLSVQVDLGYEHFFGLADTVYEADLFVPTLGVIGHL